MTLSMEEWKNSSFEFLDFGEPDKVRRRTASAIFADGEIAALLPSRERPRGVVTPGFVNGHAHWLMLGESSLTRAVDMLENHPETMMQMVMENAKQTAACGITTVCDKGPPGHTLPPKLIAQIKKAQQAGAPIPRTYSSHWTLSSPGAFAETFTKCMRSSTELIQMLEELKASGSELVKVIAEGDLTNEFEYPFTFSDCFFEEAMKFSERNQMRVAAHAKGRNTIEACIRHKIPCLEHGLQASNSQLAELERNNLFLGLTLHGFEARLNHAKNHPEKQAFKRAAEYEMELALQLAGRLANFHGNSVAHRNVVFSSDAGSHSTPHASLRETYLMRSAGFSPESIFRAATFNGYRMLGIEDKFGKIDVGYAADLIFWKCDPLALPLKAWETLENHIDAVMINGQWAREPQFAR
jgi:imidazolonepropionase-like amidohydrolase